jgi:hypothetical protein
MRPVDKQHTSQVGSEQASDNSTQVIKLHAVYADVHELQQRQAWHAAIRWHIEYVCMVDPAAKHVFAGPGQRTDTESYLSLFKPGPTNTVLMAACTCDCASTPAQQQHSSSMGQPGVCSCSMTVCGAYTH